MNKMFTIISLVLVLGSLPAIASADAGGVGGVAAAASALDASVTYYKKQDSYKLPADTTPGTCGVPPARLVKNGSTWSMQLSHAAFKALYNKYSGGTGIATLVDQKKSVTGRRVMIATNGSNPIVVDSRIDVSLEGESDVMRIEVIVGSFLTLKSVKQQATFVFATTVRSGTESIDPEGTGYSTTVSVYNKPRTFLATINGDIQDKFKKYFGTVQPAWMKINPAFCEFYVQPDDLIRAAIDYGVLTAVDASGKPLTNASSFVSADQAATELDSTDSVIADAAARSAAEDAEQYGACGKPKLKTILNFAFCNLLDSLIGFLKGLI